jgi:protocatechuate 4,5-dioxygenase beta chain
MAQLVGVLHASHGAFVALKPELWEARAAGRSYRADVPTEAFEERVAKYDRTVQALDVLKVLLHELAPDVVVVVGDDQFENFDFSNYPALSVFVGDTFAGPENRHRGQPESYHHVKGHPGLAVGILTGLMQRGFDPAFSMSDSNPAKGMCHAIMRPLHFFDAYELPVVPILVNAYYPPPISAARCYQIGRAVREAIDEYPEDLRVVAIGSGGMWHTPGRPSSYLDEEFDGAMLDFLVKGDIKGMADHFDGYTVPAGDESQDVSAGTPGMTGMPGMAGPQIGTREICNWICAAAMVDGRPHEVVDYIPIYTSPVGTAYAYCTDV